MGFSVQTIMIEGREISYRRGGSGEPLLYLHGTDSLTHWPEILDDLAKTYDVIAPDHPGFGGTAVPGWMDDVSDLAYHYLDMLEAMGIEKAHVVGHSLGGWIGLEMAVRSQERIADLVLISSAGVHVKGRQKADIFMIDPDEQARMAYADAQLGEKAAELANEQKYEDVAITDRIASARFGWNPRFYNPRLERWLHRVKRPTLIVWGDEDRIFDPSHATVLNERIPGSQLAMIAHCGHLPHIEKRSETLAAMDAFMKR